jgi:Streptomyces sporulation and cell division protein, SsgA
MSSPDLELNIDMALAVTSDLHVRMPVRFSYVCAELLDQGMRTAAGLGDVRVAPIVPCLGQRFSIELEPRGGFARLEGPVAPVEAWLATTYEAVPAGSETALWDIDRFLEQLSGR